MRQLECQQIWSASKEYVAMQVASEVEVELASEVKVGLLSEVDGEVPSEEVAEAGTILFSTSHDVCATSHNSSLAVTGNLSSTNSRSGLKWQRVSN